ncbi:hypothetical protein PV327_000742 [Microctonus hyperodae]|uniref:Cadherin domain-containing protein n=1 Tax=Microctonus hyperodae TaxID=165561 RepID=A0AA39G7Z2_MICHY|nr:hypothetical protein PV327_000742 [Microctonus hyperodae]
MWPNNGTELTEDVTSFDIPLSPILDTDKPGKLLLELNTTDVMEIIQVINNPNSNNNPYMNATLSVEGIFKLILSDNFPNYEQYETKESMGISIEFSCALGNTRKIDIQQPIEDTNNHDPIFVNAPYSYNLSMPFPKNIPIDLISGISARDIDLTNQRISFFLNNTDPVNNGLQIQWLSIDPNDSKLHYARLITTAVLDFREDVTFYIFAEDSGNPPKISNTTVTIVIDKPNSILRFTQPIYVADYTNLKPENANGTIFLFNEGEVSLSGGEDNTVKYSYIENSGEYQNNFYLKISPNQTTVQLILMDPPDKFFNESFARKSGAEETTALHISLPGRSTSKTTITTTEFSVTTIKNHDEDNDCSCADSNTVIIVLSILLIGITVGFVTFIVITWRHSKLSSSVMKNRNTILIEHAEMTEVPKNSNGKALVGPSQRSVAFNDTVEEIDTVRL